MEEKKLIRVLVLVPVVARGPFEGMVLEQPDPEKAPWLVNYTLAKKEVRDESKK